MGIWAWLLLLFVVAIFLYNWMNGINMMYKRESYYHTDEARIDLNTKTIYFPKDFVKLEKFTRLSVKEHDDGFSVTIYFDHPRLPYYILAFPTIANKTYKDGHEYFVRRLKQAVGWIKADAPIRMINEMISMGHTISYETAMKED